MPFLCLDRGTDQVLYKNNSLENVRGFAEGYEGPTRIACEIESMTSAEFMYQICIVDDNTGQIISEGPIVDVFEAGDSISWLKIVLLPVNHGKGANHAK